MRQKHRPHCRPVLPTHLVHDLAPSQTPGCAAAMTLDKPDALRMEQVIAESPIGHPEMLSLRKRVILSRLAVRLEYCFSQTSLKRASTLRLIDS